MTAAGAAPRRRRARRWLVGGVLLALGLTWVLRAWVVQSFYIPSGSMHPTLLENDKILVEKWSYWGAGTPQRGDVVVFDDPGGWLQDGDSGADSADSSDDADDGASSAFTRLLQRVGVLPDGGHLVKRVVGLPGDVVSCCDASGRLAVNGVAIDEDYLENDAPCNGPMPHACLTDWSAGPVPAGSMFVMGDHRDSSSDSSDHLCEAGQTECGSGRGMVPLSLVVGRVWLVAWPHDRWQRVERADALATLDDGRAAR